MTDPVPHGGLHPEVVIGEKEAIIAKLHQQLGDEIAAHQETKIMFGETKAELLALISLRDQMSTMITKVVVPLIAELGKNNY
jgi:hypothetical protein